MWAASQAYEILGTPVLVNCHTAELAAEVGRLLAPFPPIPAGRVRMANRFALVDGDMWDDRFAGQTLAFEDCRRVGAGGSPARALRGLFAALNRTAVENYAGFAVHAGVVARDGVAVGFPAPTGGGKSTLTAACLLSGFEYVSDEALCVDLGSGLVVPYPKPVSLTRWTREALDIKPGETFDDDGESLHTPSDLGSAHITDPLPLRYLVLTEITDGSSVEMEEVSAGNGMTALLRSSFNHFKHGAAAFHLAARLSDEATVVSVRYSDPWAAGQVLASL